MFLPSKVRYLLAAQELYHNAELRQDILRIGGKVTDEGFEFVSRRGRNMAAAIISQRWGYDATELLDLPGQEDDDSLSSLNTPRMLLVSLGHNRLIPWLQLLRSRHYNAQASTRGLQCAAALKSFRPNVMLIDESLLWGPREPASPSRYPPVRVAFLKDDDWPSRNSLKAPTGGTLPVATTPHELWDTLREHL